MPEPTNRPQHRAVAHRTSPFTLAALAAPCVSGLRIGTDGHLTEIAVPTEATAWALRPHVGVREASTGPTPGAAGVEVLGDLVMWFDLDGAEHARQNPTATVVARAFQRHETVYGPVVFTGWSRPEPGRPTGAVADIPVSAAILLAGTAPTCDLATRRGPRAVDHAAAYARLGITIVPAPREPEPIDDLDNGAAPAHDAPGHDAPGHDAPAYDALAHTVTADGDMARCVECGEYAPAGGHPEHQPEVLTDPARGASSAP